MLIFFVKNCENLNVILNGELQRIDDKIYLFCVGLWKNEKYWVLDKYNILYFFKFMLFLWLCRIFVKGFLLFVLGKWIKVEDWKVVFCILIIYIYKIL